MINEIRFNQRRNKIYGNCGWMGLGGKKKEKPKQNKRRKKKKFLLSKIKRQKRHNI